MSDDALQALRSRLVEFDELRTKKQLATKRADELKAQFNSLQEELWEALDATGLTSISVAVGDQKITFTAKETLYGNVFDREAAFAAFEAMGRADELTSTKEEKGRINELVRECLEHGQALPDGVDYYGRKVISVTKRAG